MTTGATGFEGIRATKAARPSPNNEGERPFGIRVLRVARILKGGGFFTMDDIGTGLLLNLVFWIVLVSALVFLGVWAVVELFHGLATRIQNVQKTCSVPGCREDAPQSSEAPEETGEPYRKAS